MEEKINYKDIPKNYLFCNCKQCSRHSKCLRYQAMLAIPPEVPYYDSINPNYVKVKEKECDYFQPFYKSHFACGIDNLLNNLTYSEAISVRKDLISLMGRSMFYRIRNKERLIHPLEQEQIANVFLKNGITSKPQFDKFIDKYDW
ncbi:DUF6078 family protein [uncultured Bacteroides sp.]|uniref:DUF6078 family protein n=1 Tax=uncultured Bacteroides sp. TaxID=162156 RepID=UPI0025DD3E58|nr:DUF6078 family protein [uncultured Bacteroides sp.]